MAPPLAQSPLASEPQTGDRILVFRLPWLALILTGQKTVEVRGTAYKSGSYYLGQVCNALRHTVSVVDRHRMFVCACMRVRMTFDLSGTGGMIYAQAHLGRPLRVESLRDFKRHESKHRVFTNDLPYKKTYLIPILTLKKIKKPYVHPRGAIGIVKYVPPNVSV